MISIVTPTLEAIKDVQETEGSYYWSACTETLFRSAGVISIETHAGECTSTNDVVICTRSIDSSVFENLKNQNLTFFEGPINSAILEKYSIQASYFETQQIEIQIKGGKKGSLRYPREYFDDPNGSKNKILFDSRLWASPLIHGQFFDVTDKINVIATGILADGTKGAVIVEVNGNILCGVPIFDILLRVGAFPPLAGRYFSREEVSGKVLFAELWKLIIDRVNFETLTSPLVTLRRWPKEYNSALTIRHDYDRPITEESLNSLLTFYEDAHVKCSISFLQDLAPQKITRAFNFCGHEVQLHADSFTKEQFKEAVEVVRASAASKVTGVTIHGGDGPGFIGDYQYEWALSSGLEYAELFSVPNSPVFPILRPGENGIPAPSNLMGITRHFSLDIGTTAGDSRYTSLAQSLPIALDNGEYFILMNHPDINRQELQALVLEQNLEGVWRATQGEVSNWFKNTHFLSSVNNDAQQLEVIIPTLLSVQCEISVKWQDGEVQNFTTNGGKIIFPKGRKTSPHFEHQQSSSDTPIFRDIAAILTDVPKARKFLDETACNAIENGNIVFLDAKAINENCGPRCPSHITKWTEWFISRFGGVSLPDNLLQLGEGTGISTIPLAMLNVPKSIEEYHAKIGPKSRNMLRKATRAGYTSRSFLTANYLDDIFAINTSMKTRGGVEMSAGYQSYPTSSDDVSADYCENHHSVSIGVFLEDTLVAYVLMPIVGELAVVNRILGHGEHLNQGVMNLLVEGIVRYALDEAPNIKSVNYLTLRSSRAGIDRFKSSVGFEDTIVALTGPQLGMRVLTPKTSNISFWPNGEKKISQKEPGQIFEFDDSMFIKEFQDSLIPDVSDHKNSGLRAILQLAHLDPKSKVLEAIDENPNSPGSYTTVHIRDFVTGKIDVLQNNPEIATAVKDAWGEKVNIVSFDFLKNETSDKYDLILLDMSSSVMAKKFEQLHTKARELLNDGGVLISSIIYDLDNAYNGESPLLNPSGRVFQEGLISKISKTGKINREDIKQAINSIGFTPLAVVDKWMGNGKAMAVGWLYLKKINLQNETRTNGKVQKINIGLDSTYDKKKTGSTNKSSADFIKKNQTHMKIAELWQLLLKKISS